LDDIRSITAIEIADAMPFDALIDSLAVSLSRPAVAPLRLRLSGRDGSELLVMPAMADRYTGVKILTVTAENRDNGQPVIAGLFVLSDALTGKTLAIMNASELTARRTAAVSALASRALSPPGARRLLIIGTGHLAPYLAEAHAAVRPIETIQVWGRSPAKAERCREAIRDRLPAAEVTIASDLPHAVSNADIISAATRATAPLISGGWVSPGTHIDLVGGYRPDMREIDDAGIRAAMIWVDTLEGALAEAGDLRSPIERGIIGNDAILGDIGALLAAPGPRRANAITLFKSVGSALSDLAAAELVWEALREH